MKPRSHYFKLTILTVLTVAATVLSACGPKVTPTSAAQLIATNVAQTMQVKATQDYAETLAAKLTRESKPTNTLIPTNTPVPTLTATSIPTSTPVPPTVVYATEVPIATITPSKVCLRAELITETIPDGTVMEPNQTFTKTWSFKNNGTCDWNTEFDIKFVSGNQMNAPAAINFPKNVKPGETITFSINMKAPSVAGEYTGYWILVGTSKFGIGASGTDSFYVNIVVR